MGKILLFNLPVKILNLEGYILQKKKKKKVEICDGLPVFQKKRIYNVHMHMR